MWLRRVVMIVLAGAILAGVGAGAPAVADARTACAAAGPCGDSDQDGVFDDTDNCIYAANPDQADADADGAGDVCDTGAESAPRPSGSESGHAPAPLDYQPPSVRLVAALLQPWRDLRSGMPMRVSCSEACGLEARVTVSRHTARRLGLRTSVLARAEGLLGGRGATYLIFRPAPGVAPSLHRRSVPARLTLDVVDGSYNARVLRRKLTLLR